MLQANQQITRAPYQLLVSHFNVLSQIRLGGFIY